MPVGLINLSSATVGRPVAVRYDWANNPDGNFVNYAGTRFANPFIYGEREST